MGLEKAHETQLESVDISQLLSCHQFREQVLPSIASDPSTTLSYSGDLAIPVQKLFSHLQQIHSRNLFQCLEKQDMLELGEAAREESDHELMKLADELFRIWNERYQAKV